jgi:hypothetical protein
MEKRLVHTKKDIYRIMKENLGMARQAGLELDWVVNYRARSSVFKYNNLGLCCDPNRTNPYPVERRQTPIGTASRRTTC